MRLIASLICRDEADRYLEACLRSLSRFCDFLVAFDDGSSDDTFQLLQRAPMPGAIHSMPWSVWEREGEGQARDLLLDLTLREAARVKTDWVLSIDADEVVGDGEALREFLETADREAVALRMVEVWEMLPGSWRCRVDGGWAPRDCPVVWRPPAKTMSLEARWRTGWTIPVERRLASGREPECVRFAEPAISGLELFHLGWASRETRRARYERYVKLDGGRWHDSEHLASIMGEPTLRSCPPARGYDGPWDNRLGRWTTD